MSDEFGLSDDERAQMLPSGRQSDHVQGALVSPYVAGRIARPSHAGPRPGHGHGPLRLKAHPERVDMAVLVEFLSYIAVSEPKPQPVDATATVRGRCAGLT